MSYSPLKWPPQRFKEAYEICKKCNLLSKMQSKDLLENLNKETRRKITGVHNATVTLRMYLTTLSIILEDVLENEDKFKELVKKRQQDAIWDVTFAAYVLMLSLDIIPEPMV